MVLHALKLPTTHEQRIEQILMKEISECIRDPDNFYNLDKLLTKIVILIDLYQVIKEKHEHSFFYNLDLKEQFSLTIKRRVLQSTIEDLQFVAKIIYQTSPALKLHLFQDLFKGRK